MKTKILLSLLLSSSIMLLSAQISFVEDTNNDFTGVNDGEMAFADIDGDDDPDLFILGYSNDFLPVGNFYENDGNGLFTLKNSPVPGLGYAAMAFEDVDNDNDIDLLIAGQNTTEVTTKLYLNDGAGNFSESGTSTFSAIIHGNVGFADIDNDNDPDILIAGISASLTSVVTEFYINDGNGNFSLSTNNNLTPTYQGEFDFADVDSDGDLDLLMTGTVDINTLKSATLYLNNGAGVFTEVSNTPFMAVNISSVDFEDIDGDDDQDLLITGSSDSGFSANLYQNDGNGNFSLMNNSTLVNIIFSDCAFEDIDLDGDPDLIMAGRKGAIPDETARLYVNDGNGNFTEVMDTPFIGATGSALDFADVDDDGAPDLFIMGLAPDAGIYSKLYLNSSVVSIEETIFKTNIDVYPNPFVDHFTIESTILEDDVNVELINVQGQIVKTIPHQNVSVLQVSTQDLVRGTYFLRLSDLQGRSETVRLIKAK